MSDMTIIPPHSTLVEHALEDALRSRANVGDLPNLWHPENCPARFLPWLAWALSVDDWDDAWPEATKRAVIAASIDVHRKKGTPSSVLTSLRAMGYGNARIVEAKDLPRLGGATGDPGAMPLGVGWRLGDPGAVLGKMVTGVGSSQPLGMGWTLGWPGVHWADYWVHVEKLIPKSEADRIAARLANVAPARCRLREVRVNARTELGSGVWRLGFDAQLGTGVNGISVGPVPDEMIYLISNDYDYLTDEDGAALVEE